MKNKVFTPLEESISFYARNDFAILNHLLVKGEDEDLWKYAVPAYQDNRGILEEYEKGIRSMKSDYDYKWINSLKQRLLKSQELKNKDLESDKRQRESGEPDEEERQMILRNARQDITNILDAMVPAEKSLHLYRTAWIAPGLTEENKYPYSMEYPALSLSVGDIFEIKGISSCSLTPYLEDEDMGCDFYRYEITVPKGTKILELDRFETHNEEGEVLLPPVKYKVTAICKSDLARCGGIIRIEAV